MSKEIFVAIPAYSGDVCTQTLHGLLQAKEEAHAQGWGLQAKHVYCRTGDADIAMARNAFLGAFLHSGCTDLLFVDADVSWHEGEFTRLFSHSVDLVAGIYRAKRDDEEKYCVIWPTEKRIQTLDSGFPLLEAEGVGMGFCRITRKGLEGVMSNLTLRHFYDPILPDVKCPWLFEFEWTNKDDAQFRLSEDYTFCRRWRQGGGQVWVDPSLFIDHTGKKTYCGNVIEHLRAETYKSIRAA